MEYRFAAREVGESRFIISDWISFHYRTLRALNSSLLVGNLGFRFAPPQAFANASLRGLMKIKTDDLLSPALNKILPAR